MAEVKPLKGVPHNPVTDEFRKEAHAFLDRVLNGTPGTESLVLIADYGTDWKAFSYPPSHNLVSGAAMTFFERYHSVED